MNAEMVVAWTPEKDAEFLKMAAEGLLWDEIADHFYSTGENMRFRYKTLIRRGLVKGPFRGGVTG